jgi:ERCC4-type nuclease
MPTLIVDQFESDEVVRLLESYQITVVKHNMVHMGLADFYWIDALGLKQTLEHKQASEFVANMGNRLDKQLRKHSQNADRVGVVINGVMTPKEGGGIQFWEKSKPGSKQIFYKKRTSKIGYEAVMAYIWQLTTLGFAVYFFDDLDGMCLGIASMVANSLKPEHTTLTHHTRTKPILFKEHEDIQALIGLTGIGETTAKKILARFGTPYGFYTAGYDDGVECIGKDTFLKCMRIIGRKSL